MTYRFVSLRFLALLIIVLPLPVVALTNNLALTPPMGWNDWNSYGCGISEAAVTNTIIIVATNGLAAAGYQFIDVDDGWASSRDSNGVIQAYSIPGKFPDGIKWLVNYAHSQGLKLGIYTDHGTNTCSSCITGETPPKDPGSYGYEYVDAFTYAAWDVDYLKEDNCNVPGSANAEVDYGKMSDGLMKSGRPIVFCLCGGAGTSGAKGYQSWSPVLGNYWRTTGDINDTYATMISHIDPNSTTAFAAGPGRWNDPDMLEVGNGGMNATQDQTHFTMWCMMAAPLIMGNHLTSISAASLATLTNPEAIAVDQDPAGEEGVKDVNNVSSTSTNEVWSRTLGCDFSTKAVVLFNRLGPATNITVNWTNIGLQAGTATVRDLWAHQDLGTFTNSFTANVGINASVLLKVVGTPPGLPALGTNYLSDLQAVYQYTGYGTIIKDKSIGGNTITLNGVVYPKGIGVNSFAGSDYDLGGVCSRFQATIGVDDEVGTDGSVIFQVFADGVQIYNSGVMTGGAPGQTINLDVTGVRRLILGVGDADDNINYDHGDWADALVIVTNTTPQAPETPAGLVASSGNTITLNWNDTLAAISYNVKRAINSSGPFTTVTNVPVTTFTDTNVVNGTNYFYVVSAVSSLGEGSNSLAVAATPCAPPPVPTGVTAAGTNSQVVVNWNASAGATSYNVSRFTAGTPPVVVATGLTTTNFTDTSGMAGTLYYYLVSAANSCSQSANANFVPAIVSPAAPTGLNAAGGDDAAVLNWNASLGASGYNVERSTTNGGPYVVVGTNVAGASYPDFNVVNGMTYYYVVAAVNAGGESANSTQVAVTPEVPLTAYWTNTVTGAAQNWNVNANWTNAATFPNSSGELTIINASIAAPQTINLNQAITIGSMQIGDASGLASYTLAANGGSLTFSDVNTVELTQLASSKGDMVASPVILTTNLVVINDSTNPLTLAGNLSSSGGGLTVGSGVLVVGDGTTNGSLGSVSVDDNSALVFNRSDYVTNSGVISGSGSIAQRGTGNLTLSGANTFSGGTTISNGTLKMGNAAALGGANGTVAVTNGGTLDVNGNELGAEPILVSGWGVSSNGAVVSSSASAQDDALQHVTLTGNTAFGGPGNWQASGNPGRWDIRGAGTTLTMSGGQPFNLYKTGSNQVSIVGVAVDTNLATIDIQQGMMGFEDGSSSMGNPAGNLIVRAGATLEFYQSSAVSNSYTKQFMLFGDGVTDTITNWPGGGSSTISGQMALNGACIIGVNGTSFTNNCSITGSGSLTKGGSQPLTLGGADTYTGNTTVNGGLMILSDNGSISGSLDINVNAGATLDASARSDATLTLAGSQTLTGSGAVKGNAIIGAGATLAPGNGIGTLTFSNNLTLNGGSMTVMGINKSVTPASAVAQVNGNLTCNGTLVVTNLGTIPFSAGDSFKLFNAANYYGLFTNITPAIPGLNLAWNTNGLSSGLLGVISAPTSPPRFSAVNFNGSGFVFSGSNGVANWTYYVLTATNVTLPLTNWTMVSTNAFDGRGNFIFTNPAGLSALQNFYLLKFF